MTTAKSKNVRPAAAKPTPRVKRAVAPRHNIQTRQAVKKIAPRITADKSIKPKGEYVQTLGRRKSAIARLRLKRGGNGQIIINNKDFKQYFPFPLWQEVMTAPLQLVGLDKNVDLSVKVSGGGLPAQAEAIRLALARALIIDNVDCRPTLRKMGYLTRDPREKERKKPGLKRARRAPQWQKR